MNRLSAKHGFTLIELIIALAVAALLLAWGVPSFQRFMDNAALTSETNNWVGVVNHARSEAVTRGERVTICRTIAPEACDGSANCLCGVSQPGAENGRPNYHRGYLVFTSTGNAQPINFLPGNDNVLIATGRTQSDKITIRGNGQGNNAFSFMPDGTLDPNDVDPDTARHVICVTGNTADLQSSQNSEQVGTERARVAVISPTGRPRVAGADQLDAAGVVPTDCQGTDGDSLAD